MYLRVQTRYFYPVDVDVTGDDDRWEKKEEYNWDKWS